MSSCFNTVTSASKFNNLFESERGNHVAQLTLPAASSWNREHLLACRVVRMPKQDGILPLLARYTSGTKWSTSNPNVEGLLAGPDPSHQRFSEHQLVRIYGVSLGQTWAALGAFEMSDDAKEDDIDSASGQPSTKRMRRRTLQEGFVDSSAMRVGSSSPLTGDEKTGENRRSSHGSNPSSIGYTEKTAHGQDAPPEDKTIRLVSCFVRHVLYFCPPQDNADLELVVEFRDEKLKIAATSGPHELRGVDDGGLYLRNRLPEGSYRLGDSRVAILEAKKRFQQIQNGRPTITDESFAQMVGEALAARFGSDDEEQK